MENKYISILEKYVKDGYFTSAVLKIFSPDKTLVSCDVGDVDINSIFDVASLTKLVTSTQIMYLIKSGILSIYDKAIDYIPEILGNSFLQERLKDVSVFSMLTHTSTLPKWFPLYALEGSFAQRLEQALKVQEIASGVTYSDINFMLLGKIVEQCYNMPLDEALKKCLVQPFKLGNMCYNPIDKESVVASSFNNNREKRFCQSIGMSFNGFRENTIIKGEANDGNAYYYFNGVAGHAGIFANADSFKNLCQMYMSKNCPFLRSAMQNKGMDRGFGFEFGSNYPNGCGHSGFTGTALWISKSRKVGVVFFTNRLFALKPKSNNDMWIPRKEIFYEAAKDFDEI